MKPSVPGVFIAEALPPSPVEPPIGEQADEHTRSALLLAITEQRPPGYSEVDWACYLMDLHPARLRERLLRRVAREYEAKGTCIPFTGHKRVENILPLLPKHLPAAIEEKKHQWAQNKAIEAIQQRCERVFRHGRGISEGEAGRLVHQVVRGVMNEYQSLSMDVGVKVVWDEREQLWILDLTVRLSP